MRQFLHVRMQLECSDPSKRSDAAVAQDMRISRQKALLQILREGSTCKIMANKGSEMSRHSSDLL